MNIATYRLGLVGVFIQSVTADCAGRRGRHGNAATLSRGHDDGRAADAIVMRDIAAGCCCCSSSSCSLVCHWVAPPRLTRRGQHAALWRSRDTGSPLDCNTNRVFLLLFLIVVFLFCEDTKGRGYRSGGFVKVLSTVKLYNNSNEGLFLGTKSRLSLRVIAFWQLPYIMTLAATWSLLYLFVLPPPTHLLRVRTYIHEVPLTAIMIWKRSPTWISILWRYTAILLELRQ